MTIRVSRVSAQVAGQHTTGDMRVTRVAAKVAGNVTDGKARVTKAYAQVAGAAAATDSLEVSRLKIQVGTTGTGDIRRYTSELGTHLSSMGLRSMVLGLPPFFVDTPSLSVTAGNTLALTQSASAAISGIIVTASNALTFSQTNSYNKTFGGLTASDTITFAQSASGVIPGGDVVVTATSSLTLTQTNAFVRARIRTADDTLTLTQTSDMSETSFGVQVLNLTQSAVGNVTRSLTASQTLNLQHGFSAVQFRDGVPVQGVGQCDATKIYAPYQGGGSSGIPVNQPTLNRRTDVALYYPAGAELSATDTLTLRTPNFGNRDRNQFNRINRESRGGSLRVYRDPKWPKIRSLVMDFSGIKDSEVDSIILFLETYLGQEIGLRDWNDVVWTGVVMTPEAEVVRTGTDRNDVNITIEVTQP